VADHYLRHHYLRSCRKWYVYLTFYLPIRREGWTFQADLYVTGTGRLRVFDLASWVRRRGLRVRRVYGDVGPPDVWPRPGLRTMLHQWPAGGARIICVQSYSQLTGNVAELALLHRFLEDRGGVIHSRNDPFLPSKVIPNIDDWWMHLTIWLPYLYWYGPPSPQLIELLREVQHQREEVTGKR
jgi:hypothetical protein